jgi:predicted AAA+ superfamily ATPase
VNAKPGSPVDYRTRLVDERLALAVAQLPAVLVVGPRACGKTTTAARHVASAVRLNREADAVAFRADPDVALGRLGEPALLDEWQEVPGVLAAVKRAVDADPHPGRFVLTGSVSAELSDNSWPGTGRITRIPMWGLTVGEALEASPSRLLVDRLHRADLSAFGPPAGTRFDLADYVELALAGGFPDPVLNRTGAGRQLWLESYLDELVHHDAALLRAGIDSGRFASYLEAIAVNNAGVVDDSTILDSVRIDRRTAQAYWQLLERLFMVEAVPAWWSNRLTRLVSLEKRYLVDTALMATALRLGTDEILRDGNLLGRVVDSFVAMQLRPEITVSSLRPRMFHLRDKGGRHEVDLVIEYGGGRVAGIEIKATGSPAAADARHLVWLRDRLGDRFTMGLVLHTGPTDFELEDRIVAAPISTLWA